MADPERAAGPEPIHLSPEWSVLVACARHASLSGRAETSPDAAGDEPSSATPLDWDDLLALADRHGLSAFLQRYLDDGAAVAPPEAVAQRLRERVRLRTRENLRLTGGLIALAPALRAEGIDAMAYKGPVLSQRLHGNPTVRDYDDLDLIVRRRDVEGATRLLESRGLRPWFDLEADQEGRLADSQYARHFGDAETGIAVDLHWGFAQPYLSFAIDEPTIWETSQEVVIGGARIPTLADPLLLLVLCIHGSKHEPWPWYRVKWIVDVAGLARRLPADRWEPLVERARTLRVERPFLFGLLVAHRLLDAPLAPPVASRLREAPDLEAMTRAVLATLTAPPDVTAPDSGRIDWDLRLLDRWPDRARYVLHRLFVPNPKDWAAFELPSWLAPAYWVLRPFRLWSAAWRRRRER